MKLTPKVPPFDCVRFRYLPNSLFFPTCLANALMYTMRVPEGERHDSAIKRNNEALSAELKIWDGYLKVPLQLSDRQKVLHRSEYIAECGTKECANICFVL